MKKFVTCYGYCHLLDGANLSFKFYSNQVRFSVKNVLNLVPI